MACVFNMDSCLRAAVMLFVLLPCIPSVASVEVIGTVGGRTLRGKDVRSTVETSTLRDHFHNEYLHANTAALEEIERSLAPMYVALPKKSNGWLDHATTAYALRRYFLGKYGWQVTGLTPQGSSLNFKSASATKVMEGRVPGYLQELLEDELGGRGLNLEKLSTLVFMLEQALHEESIGWLSDAYRLVGAPLTGRATEEQVTAALETFMLLYQNDKDIHKATPQWLEKFKKKLQDSWALELWKQTKTWLRDTERSVAYSRRCLENPFVNGALSFPAAERLLAEVHRRYSWVQHSDCREMKDTLLSMEYSRASGRITFEKFNATSTGDKDVGVKWDFGETLEDLQKIGALDESDPSSPKLVVANYIYNPGNCLASSELHKVCCIDECEVLLSEVEKAVGAPTGAPAEIVRAVAELETATVEAPRNLSAALLTRLGEVAQRHGARVPLHGRLFAQWMHHAFPNECAQPISSSNTATRTVEEYMRESTGGAELLPWSDEEELVGDEVAPDGIQLSVSRLVVFAAFLFVALSSMRKGLDRLLGAGGAGWDLPGSHRKA